MLLRLARLEKADGQIERAASYYEDSVATWLASDGENSWRTARALTEYAEVLRLLGRNDEADKMVNRVGAIGSRTTTCDRRQGTTSNSMKSEAIIGLGLLACPSSPPLTCPTRALARKVAVPNGASSGTKMKTKKPTPSSGPSV